MCIDCPKEFPSISKLERHRRVHTGERPFACPKCGGVFTQNSSLQTHLGKHRHSCPTCHAAKLDTAQLRAHRKVHAAAATQTSQVPFQLSHTAYRPLTPLQSVVRRRPHEMAGLPAPSYFATVPRQQQLVQPHVSPPTHMPAAYPTLAHVVIPAPPTSQSLPQPLLFQQHQAWGYPAPMVLGTSLLVRLMHRCTSWMPKLSHFQSTEST